MTDRPDEASAIQPSHERRLRSRIDDLATRTGGGLLGERRLMLIAGIVAPTGLVVVLFGWWGAARTPNLHEQVPYLISGGLFGLGLVLVGAFAYFAHWLTELVRETRQSRTDLQAVMVELRDALASRPSPAALAADPVVAEASGAVLVATARGSLAHRPECAAVAGKDGLRRIDPGDGLARCKLCDPGAGVARQPAVATAQDGRA